MVVGSTFTATLGVPWDLFWVLGTCRLVRSYKGLQRWTQNGCIDQRRR